MKDIKDSGNVQGEPRAYTTERKQMNDIEIVLICDDGYIVPTLTTVFLCFKVKMQIQLIRCILLPTP